MSKKAEDVFVYKNRGRCSLEEPNEINLRLERFCNKNGYRKNGAINISEPISRCESELQWIIDYCLDQGIRKILVDSIYDIGETSLEITMTSDMLCGQGFQIVIASNDLILSGVDKISEEPEEYCLTMGGM